MPACREDVRQQNKVGLVLCALWQLECVKIGKRDANILRLASLVWLETFQPRSQIGSNGYTDPHCDVAVGTTCESRVHTTQQLAFR